MLMLVHGPAYLAVMGNSFSSTVSVGISSHMIIGFEMRVIAKTNDLDVRRLVPLWTAFVPLNLGHGMRAGLALMTDYATTAFIPTGVAGFIVASVPVICAVDVSRPLAPKGLRRTYSVT